MVISSKFRDYYDQVQALGHDASLSYQRHQQVLVGPAAAPLGPLEPLAHRLKQQRPEFWIDGFGAVVVGFCGKLYLAARPLAGPNETSALAHNRPFFYEEAVLRKARPDLFATKPIAYYDAWGQDPYITTLGYYAAEEAAFLQLGVPVFALDTTEPPRGNFNSRGTSPGYTLTLNPCLQDYEFFRVLGAYEAYQELELYLGNTLLNAAPPPQPVADGTVIDRHGFDPKMGFRKRKKG